MKKIFYSVLALTTVLFVASSCSNGAFNTNPNSNANSSVNPLNPLKVGDFTWGGDGMVSGDINGAHWTADTAYFGIDSLGNSMVTAYKKVGHYYAYMTFHLKIYQIEGDNLFPMGFRNYDDYATYIDSGATLGALGISYLGNSGEIDVMENDSAFIKAKFYCQMVTPNGLLLNINNGNINIPKTP
jgi:hypothetical protein